MKHAFVLILSVVILGTIVYFRNNPQAIDSVQKKISQTETVSSKKLLLPDMMILPPKELYITTIAGRKALRFSTTFVNKGAGPLEIIGHHDLEQNKTYATQYIREASGSGQYRDVGEFVYHPEHDHWHVDDYVSYQIWTIKNNNEKDQPMASTGKQSFCIWDEHTYDLNLSNAAPKRFYTSACSRNTQGMSVGWGDTYLAKVEGQVIDIDYLPDGQYILSFNLNPEKTILESDYTNNSDWLKIEITGNQLKNLGKN